MLKSSFTVGKRPDIALQSRGRTNIYIVRFSKEGRWLLLLQHTQEDFHILQISTAIKAAETKF